jgi:hypothetical protein
MTDDEEATADPEGEAAADASQSRGTKRKK